MGRPSKWSPEFREEAIRLYRESDESVSAVARRLGLGPETFRKYRQSGMRRLLCFLMGHKPSKPTVIMGLQVRTCVRCARTI